jgi:hypothetical protein
VLRVKDILWLAVVVAAAFALYLVKFQVDALKTQVGDTQMQLADERESMHVAEAEWAYLNRPERLQYLAKKYLALSALRGDQMAEIENIPFSTKDAAAAMPDAAHDARLKQAVMQQSQLRDRFIAAPREETHAARAEEPDTGAE